MRYEGAIYSIPVDIDFDQRRPSSKVKLTIGPAPPLAETRWAKIGHDLQSISAITTFACLRRDIQASY